MKRVVDAVNNGNIDVYRDLHTPDFIRHQHGSELNLDEVVKAESQITQTQLCPFRKRA